MKMKNKKKLKYYIIKDLDTGLYYRGKGQNRWGKYYNQASIFRNLAQANNSVESLKRCDKSNAVAIEIEITELTQELSDCIKEWEEKEWTYRKSKRYNWFFVEKDYEIICFDCDKINYSCAGEFDIDLELSALIRKTLKAMEAENENSRKN